MTEKKLPPVLEALGASFSAATGGKKLDMNKAWAEVQANMKRLKECPRPHDFVPLDEKKFGGKSRCTKCQGTLDNINVLYYREGLADGLALGRP